MKSTSSQQSLSYVSLTMLIKWASVAYSAGYFSAMVISPSMPSPPYAKG
jgi:hypothetical protein